jgi:hypothetical protein
MNTLTITFGAVALACFEAVICICYSALDAE